MGHAAHSVRGEWPGELPKPALSGTAHRDAFLHRRFHEWVDFSTTNVVLFWGHPRSIFFVLEEKPTAMQSNESKNLKVWIDLRDCDMDDGGADLTGWGHADEQLARSFEEDFDEIARVLLRDAAPELRVLARCVPKRCPPLNFLRSDRRPLMQGGNPRAHRDEDRLDGSRLCPRFLRRMEED